MIRAHYLFAFLSLVASLRMTKMDDLVPVDELIPPPTELNDSHKVYSIAVVCIVLCIVTTFLVLVRLGYRIQSRTLGADDYATIPSVVGKKTTSTRMDTSL